MILIHPPLAKACEPPAGPAVLAGALARHGIPCRVVDANLECLLALLKTPLDAHDRWTVRAARHVERNLGLLSSWGGYANLDRYKRAVADLNRVAGMAAACRGARVSLADYQDQGLSPVRSRDLLQAAEHPERNPFYVYFKDRLEGLLDACQPEVIGFSLNYLSQALCTFAMAGFLKRIAGRVKIVAGGGLVTSWLRRPGWRDPFGGLIDWMVAGPGEAFLLKLHGVTALRESGPPDFSAFTGLPYLAPGFVLPYSASSGCYWSRCSFCPERAERNPFKPLPRSRVLEDLASLAGSVNPVLVHLLDNAVSPAILKALAQGGPGKPWYGFARVSERLADPDFGRALKSSGCVMLKLGLESGDQGVLDRMGKGIRLETTRHVLENLKRAGIVAYVYLLFGTPAEGLAEARRTLEFTVRHSHAIGFLNLAVFNLPIHSPDSEGLRTEAFYEGDLSLYARFSHPKGWDRHLVRQFLDKEFRRHPAVAAILCREPPLFTSNHAPLFCLQRR